MTDKSYDTWNQGNSIFAAVLCGFEDIRLNGSHGCNASQNCAQKKKKEIDDGIRAYISQQWKTEGHWKTQPTHYERETARLVNKREQRGDWGIESGKNHAPAQAAQSLETSSSQQLQELKISEENVKRSGNRSEGCQTGRECKGWMKKNGKTGLREFVGLCRSTRRPIGPGDPRFIDEMG